MIFAVLDVSLAVNLCINCSLKNIYLQFYYVSVAVALNSLLPLNCLHVSSDFIVLIGLILVSFSFYFSVRFHVVDSVGNSSVVTAREISHRCTITIIMVPKFWGFCLETRQFVSA